MRQLAIVLLLFPLLLAAQPQAKHNLVFSTIPAKWHEGIPLGNGLLGCLVWQKDGKLRLALDRADLWDSRPMNGLDRPEFSYQWVAGQRPGSAWLPAKHAVPTRWRLAVPPVRLGWFQL